MHHSPEIKVLPEDSRHHGASKSEALFLLLAILDTDATPIYQHLQLYLHPSVTSQCGYPKSLVQSSLPRSQATIPVSERKGIVRTYNVGASSLLRSWRRKDSPNREDSGKQKQWHMMSARVTYPGVSAQRMGVESETSSRVFDRHVNGQGLTYPKLRSVMVSQREPDSCRCRIDDLPRSDIVCIGARASSLPRELDSGSK